MGIICYVYLLRLVLGCDLFPFFGCFCVADTPVSGTLFWALLLEVFFFLTVDQECRFAMGVLGSL